MKCQGCNLVCSAASYIWNAVGPGYHYFLLSSRSPPATCTHQSGNYTNPPTDPSIYHTPPRTCLPSNIVHCHWWSIWFDARQQFDNVFGKASWVNPYHGLWGHEKLQQVWYENHSLNKRECRLSSCHLWLCIAVIENNWQIADWNHLRKKSGIGYTHQQSYQQTMGENVPFLKQPRFCDFLSLSVPTNLRLPAESV